MEVLLEDPRAALVEAGVVVDVVAAGGRYLLQGIPFRDPIVVRWSDGDLTVHVNPLDREMLTKVQAAVDADNAKRRRAPFL